MKNLLSLLFFCTLFYFKANSQITLSHNVGDDVKFKNMFSCYQTEWWARDFTLNDFGITENQEYIINGGITRIRNGHFSLIRK